MKRSITFCLFITVICLDSCTDFLGSGVVPCSQASVKNRIVLFFPTSVQGRPTSVVGCDVVPKADSDPRTTIGIATDPLVDNSAPRLGYYCEIDVISSNNCYVGQTKFLFINPSQDRGIDIQVPLNYQATIKVKFYEACNLCTPNVKDARSLFTGEDIAFGSDTSYLPIYLSNENGDYDLSSCN
jgi:hypothetical protein